MITIKISGPRSAGKTAIAHAIRRALEKLHARVAIEDPGDSAIVEANAEKIVMSKCPQVVIKVETTNAVGA